MTKVAVWLFPTPYPVFRSFPPVLTRTVTLEEKEGTHMDTLTKEHTRALIIKALRQVYDPELGVNVIDLGLIYTITVDDQGYVTIEMTLTTPGCPLHESISEGVRAALQEIPGITGGEVRLVWNPPWNPTRLTAEGRRELGWA